MKKIIFIFLSLFIFSCDSEGGSGINDPGGVDTGGGDTGGGDISNCNGCPINSLSSLINLNESNNEVTCNYSEISNLGCVNIIETDVDEENQIITIYYNIESDISGFQFDVRGITVDSIQSYLPSSFDLQYSTLNNDDVRFIAFSFSGGLIENNCGALFQIEYSSAEGQPWDSSDFISTIVFSGNVSDNNIPSSIDVCAN